MLLALSAHVSAQENDAPRMMQHMWDMADSDRDGRISKMEFTAMQERRFATLDANKDGSIDRTERDQAQQKMRQHMKGLIDGIKKPPSEP
ncbi:MAG TPA: hypothetical protein PKE41_01660 [Candidatus Macondimonas sp.]|nr:hypothetical protein [Candidatus Macondimonas sp.]